MAFVQILSNVNLSLNQILLTFWLYVRQTWMTQLVLATSSFNLKGYYYSYACSGSLCEGRTSFCMELISRKLCWFLLMFLIGFTIFSVLLLFPLSITYFVFRYMWSLILFHVT